MLKAFKNKLISEKGIRINQHSSGHIAGQFIIYTSRHSIVHMLIRIIFNHK